MTNISRIAASAVAALALALGASAAGATLPAAAQGSAAQSSAAQGSAARAAEPAWAPPIELSARSAVGSAASLNSAGYAVSRSRTRFRDIRATFFVPYLDCALSPGAFSSDWIGLDGFVGRPDSVEQAGIGADCTGTGRSRYRAWFAMYPRGQVRAKVTIKGGDSVTASISYDPADGEFSLALTDTTTGGHFRERKKCPRGVTCPRTSAELISSAPATGKTGHLTIKSLADYGAVSFTAISVTDGSGQRGGLRSARWGTTRIVATQQASPFGVIARPTPVQADTFDTYWSRER